MNKQEIIDYDFKCTTPSDFELELSMKADNQLFEWLYEKSSKKLGHKVSETLKDKKPSDVEMFEVPPMFYSFVNSKLRKIKRKIFQGVERDGIVEQKHWINKIMFYRQDNDTWLIKIRLGGVYSRI
jgi:hypothetical protein